MSQHRIISRGQALQILKHDLRKAALDQHAAELQTAAPEQRQKILDRIDKDIEKELRRRARSVEPDTLIH